MGDRALACLVLVPFLLGAAAAPDRERHVTLTFRDPAIVESSGLVALGDAFVTANDSGDTGRVFVVDPGTGATRAVVGWSADATDVEALAPAGPHAVWVGDIGDNSASRESVRVARVAVGDADATVRAPTYELRYPDGSRDAESLLVDPTSGRVYVASKGVFGGVLYEAPRRLSADGPNRLAPLGRIMAIATDGAFFPDGRHVVLRDYSRATVYAFPSLEKVGTFDLPEQQQGEGIAVDARGRVFVSSEGQDSEVLRVALPAGIRRALRGDEDPALPPSTSASASASPSSGPERTGGTSEADGQDGSSGTPWGWSLGGLAGLGVLGVLGAWLRRRHRPRRG